MGGAYTDDERAGLEDPTQTAMMEGLTSSTSGSGSSHDGGDNQEMEELESELGDGDGDDNGDSVDDELASSSVKSMDLDDKAKDKEPISPSSASYDDDDDYYEKCLGLSDPVCFNRLNSHVYHILILYVDNLPQHLAYSKTRWSKLSRGPQDPKQI